VSDLTSRASCPQQTEGDELGTEASCVAQEFGLRVQPLRNFRGDRDATYFGSRRLTEGWVETHSSINPSPIIGAYALSFRKQALFQTNNGSFFQNTVLGQGKRGCSSTFILQLSS